MGLVMGGEAAAMARVQPRQPEAQLLTGSARTAWNRARRMKHSDGAS